MDLESRFYNAVTIMNESVRAHNMNNAAEKKLVEDKIIALIDADEEIATCNTYLNKTLGMYACMNKLNNVAKRCLRVGDAGIQTDDRGYNIGMYAACYGLEDVVLEALEDKTASCQQNRDTARNIGMLCALNDMKKASFKALDNKKASCQQDFEGFNIGMIVAKNGWDDCVLKALDNTEARHQTCSKATDKGKTIADFPCSTPH